jgi:hypothetical protein
MLRYCLLVTGTLLVTTALPAQSRSPVVSGQVTDSAGCPLPQAVVFVPNTTFRTNTDTRGEFAFDTLPANLVSLRAGSIGYVPRQLDSVRVEPGRTTRVTFRLPLSNLKPTCRMGPIAPAPK